MGNNGEVKSDKLASPAPVDLTNVHLYPDWAAMQAYYGPRVSLQPYYNPALASGHPPHPYMWGPPQPMMSPYAAPYAAIYSPGGIYPHPTVPLGSYSHGHGVPLSPAAATPLSMERPTKSSGDTDRGLMKKLKGFEGLAMSIGNGDAEDAEHGFLQSVETEGSSGGSDGNSSGDQTQRKRSREGTPIIGGDEKTEMRSSSVHAAEVTAFSNKVLRTVVPASVEGKLIGAVNSLGMNTDAKASPTAKQGAVIPADAWVQNERELKRERRKQSNRESARRSRLRKQAESEELSCKVEDLTAENMALKSEIHQFTGKSEKLRLENVKLMGILKTAQLGQTQAHTINNIDDVRAPPVGTENLLSRVNNSGSDDSSSIEKEGDIMYEKNSSAKLHQLLDTNPRADVVAAG
ncbi:bZIP_1 domain-containing protein/MFMR domain-containing protein [Cephalotus follicularis]|uniref:BZIP_1 domain-containing protein/MFMR domain-containing protein n=1 Tax=Cephalotus follicularis TaxID=3775 RepID=A0A1Q3BX36_CEPFO|nr:bZIP_1 domain-containing protein/MFMR domain-containing protein [Cephalotus follicularis]